MGQSVGKTDIPVSDVEGYVNMNDFLIDIQRNIADIRARKRPADECRLIVQSHRNFAAGVALQLEFARLSGSMVKGLDRLPSLEFGLKE